MAVGKGSMERASKAVKKAPAKEAPVKETAVKETPVKATPAKKSPAKKAPAKKAVVANTSEQVMEQIVYQKSSQMLERDAQPNESFYIGDAMPIYYF